MFILSVRGKSKEEGAYAVEDEDGQKVLFLFEEEDDAVRYAMMMSMSDEEYPALDVTEVPDDGITGFGNLCITIERTSA